MRNLINRPFSRFGMPYHGLVTDSVLSTPDGDITVPHDASVEGAIAFQVRNPKGNVANAAQQAMDTLHGWDWRDYILLNGWFRSVNGGPQLGATKWLYADDNDTVWVMELKGTLRLDSPTYYYDLELWRREPFGHFMFGGERTVADQLLATWSPVVSQMSYRSGGQVYTYPAGTFGNQMSLKASGIVPNLHGDRVHIHVLNGYNNVLEGTNSYWELAFRGVWATATITISGAGDINNDGAGITGAFTNGKRYPDFLSRAADIPSDLATINPWPLNHITTYDTSDCPAQPSGPGTCQESCSAVFTNSGVTFTGHTRRYAWDGDSAGEPDLGDCSTELFTYHGASGDKVCLQQYYRWDNGEDYGVYLEGQGGGPGSEENSSEQTLTATTDDGGETWHWVAGPTTRVCSAWKATEGEGYLYNNVAVDVDGNVDSIEVNRWYEAGNRQILGVGTPTDCGCISWQSDDGYPGPIGEFGNVVYNFSEPYSLTVNDVDAYCRIDQQCSLIIFPGMVAYVAAHGVPNGGTPTQVRHRGKLWGIGADGSLTQITIWGPVVETDRVIRFPWTSVAWQPMTKQFGVETDGVTLVKYI